MSQLLAADRKEFTVRGGESDWLNMPVAVSLDGLRPCGDDEMILLEQVIGTRRFSVPCQVEPGPNAQLWFIPLEPIPSGNIVSYEISLKSAEAVTPVVIVERTDKEFKLLTSQGPVLDYYYALHDVPAGVDPAFRRSGFIHPLWSPGGQVLTEIQPKDHYHHYGIWNPWTKTHIEGREIDFWNLVKKQGTVRFAGLLAIETGPVFARLAVRQEHVMFESDGRERVAMNELWDIKASSAKLKGKPVWVIDLTSTLNNNLDSPIELAEYRYGGGLGFRATDLWTNKNSTVLTSEGKTRKEADASRARWCNISGQTDQGKAGILFLSHDRNREHPEPMRMWPEDANGGRGDVFFEFCPIRLKNWFLQPDKTYVLSYRMIVYDGDLDVKIAEVLWNNFVNPLAAE